MNRTVLFASLAMGVMGAMAAPANAQACDISDTKCAVNGGKCNIKFRNRTGDSGGSDGSSTINQRSSAQIVVVKARKGDGSKAGNKLKIQAGTSKTMNIDKKANKNFWEIQILSKDNGSIVHDVKMPCENVKAVLNGNGNCKVFHGQRQASRGEFNYYLGYQCDGGKVGGPN